MKQRISKMTKNYQKNILEDFTILVNYIVAIENY